MMMLTTTGLMRVLPMILLLTPSCHALGSSWLAKGVATVVLSSLSINSNDPQDLLRSLTAPTEDTPQIVMPSVADGAGKAEKQPLVQGLVYLMNPRQVRPDPSEVLILSVRSAAQSGGGADDAPVLAGAKIPVSRLRFPMSFAMSEKNILPGKTLSIGDLLVDAKICPSVTPCSQEEASFQAKGIAKVISNIPGLDGSSMRAAASLGLK
jgi:hypothetical protein